MRHRPRAWSIHNPGNAAARAELMRAIRAVADQDLESEGSVLDVGCGTGWLLDFLASAGVSPARLHGVDTDPRRVKAARGRAPDATVALADGRELPWPAARFRVVVLCVMLSSLATGSDEVAALREARRVLAPGGLIVVYDTRFPNPLNRRTRVVRSRELEAAGLTPRNQRSLTLLPPIGRRVGGWPFLYRWLSKIPALRSHRLVTYRAPAGDPRKH